ncbi:MAG: hypothetical protein LUB59_04585 [Candidatus Gastranaerophilales bacterium]|nr:hypothetical protein [Candidatus Gastranaerophilales bacterium]
MAVAGLLAQYLAVKNQISYNQLQDTRWNDLATAMSKKLSEQENYQEKWDDSSMALYDDWGGSKTYTAKGTTFYDPAKGTKGQSYSQELAAEYYAYAKVPKYDPDKLDEYTELDMEYSTMVSMYDTLIEELNAQAESLKETISTESQDTHLLGS